MVSSTCDGELYATELAHADCTVGEPGRCQVTQRDPLTLLTAILVAGGGKGGRGEGGGEGREEREREGRGKGGRVEEGQKGGEREKDGRGRGWVEEMNSVQ